MLPQAAAQEEKGANGLRGRRKLLLMDLRKAHLHATPVREIYVQLPPELKAEHPGKCWLLRRCLYGTRDAPARWEALYTERLRAMGFNPGKASGCCFYHPQRQIRGLVHGDDFVFEGAAGDLDWVCGQLKHRDT